MMEKNFRFSFKPVHKMQQELILSWIVQEHINEWLHGEGLKNTIEDLENFVNHRPAWATHWLAYDNKIPFAYLITSQIEKSDKNPNDITLDLFICRLDYLGKGFGVQLIHEFLMSQFSHVNNVLIDQEIANARAVYVYKKAGFKIINEFIASWHPVPHYQMRLSISELMNQYNSIQ